MNGMEKPRGSQIPQPWLTCGKAAGAGIGCAWQGTSSYCMYVQYSVILRFPQVMDITAGNSSALASPGQCWTSTLSPLRGGRSAGAGGGDGIGLRVRPGHTDQVLPAIPACGPSWAFEPKDLRDVLA